MQTILSASPETAAADPRYDAFAADEGSLRGYLRGHIRHDLVIRVRRQIEMGLYEEDPRIDALLDRLMADLGVD